MTSACPSRSYGLRVYAFLQCISSRVDGFLECIPSRACYLPSSRFVLGFRVWTSLIWVSRYAITICLSGCGSVPSMSPFRGLCFAAHRMCSVWCPMPCYRRRLEDVRLVTLLSGCANCEHHMLCRFALSTAVRCSGLLHRSILHFFSGLCCIMLSAPVIKVYPCRLPKVSKERTMPAAGRLP